MARLRDIYNKPSVRKEYEDKGLKFVDNRTFIKFPEKFK